MNRQIRFALGAVAGVLLLVAATLWFAEDDVTEPTVVPVVSEPEAPVIPTYEDPSLDTTDSDLDDQAHDVTRIIIRQPSVSEDVNIDEVLAGKVIVDDQVIARPEN